MRRRTITWLTPAPPTPSGARATRCTGMPRYTRSFGRPATGRRPAVEAIVHLAEEVNADLLVVGDVGLDTVAGRLLGSVPADVARRAKIDILIVHTAG